MSLSLCTYLQVMYSRAKAMADSALIDVFSYLTTNHMCHYHYVPTYR